MGGAASRDKGKRGEREVALIFKGAMLQVEIACDIEPEKRQSAIVERNLQQSIAGGHDIVGIPLYAVEVKRVEKPQLGEYWKQTIEQAAKVQLKPLMVFKQTGRDWKARTVLFNDRMEAIVADCNFMEWIKLFQNEYYYTLEDAK